MKNQPKPNDFFLEVEGVGQFRFNRKTYGSQIKIDAAIVRILGPNMQSEDATMNMHANMVGSYGALMVDCPPGWEKLEDINLDEYPEREGDILKVCLALREKLHSFRRPAAGNEASQGAGQGNAPDDRVLGAPQVQPNANGSPVAGAVD